MCSILESWSLWLLATSTSKHEKVQLEAARAITDLVRSTQVEAVLAESQLPPISMRLQTISLLKADEWAHLPPADDHHQTLFTACRQRLKRKDWCYTLHLHSSHMVRFEMEWRMAVPVLQSSAKMASSTSGMIQRAPIVAPSR